MAQLQSNELPAMSVPVLYSDHPLYLDRKRSWIRYLVSYIGGDYARGIQETSNPLFRRLSVSSLSFSHDYQDLKLLWQHEAEDTKDYNARLATSYYARHAGQALDELVSLVLEGCNNPTIPSRMPPDWLENVDGKGTSWINFVAEAAIQGLLYGYFHVMADLPVIGEPNPYCYLVSPLELESWTVDDWSKYTMVQVRECVATDSQKRTATDRIRQWTPEWVSVWDNGKLISQVPNQFGFIPIRTVYFQKDVLVSDSPMGRSWMEDPARLNEEHYNINSYMMEIARKCTFPIMALPTPAGEGNITKEQRLQISINQAIALPAGSGQPLYLAPSRDSIDVLKMIADGKVTEIRRLGGLTMPGEETQGVQSAEALRLKRATLNALLSKYARNLELGLSAVGQMVCSIAGWNGNPDEDFVQLFPDDYEKQDKSVTLDAFQKVVDLGLPESVLAILKKEALRTVLPNLASELWEGIEAELDAEVQAEKERQAKSEQRAVELEATMLRTPQQPPSESAEDNGDQEPTA